MSLHVAVSHEHHCVSASSFAMANAGIVNLLLRRYLLHDDCRGGVHHLVMCFGRCPAAVNKRQNISTYTLLSLAEATLVAWSY